MRISTPGSSSSNPGSTMLLQSGPPRVVRKSSRSRGGENADVSTSGVGEGSGIITETREAHQSVAPPAYEVL
ncbi:hypothetical protein K443DRAFT_684192 [Laccaria amethystina LaAM-08-1]|uniref:Uncharacterized protein n=1 Tax=Laccaria amethystina LaAM-08-1 TaxID=1095629 RepID=A0A0C9WR65_9AGAR|nr:hypothetical protein K443DRAFT_684192 [Laccaria amethystina LaAM-08-1]